jgi:hypothetical protein
MATLVQVRGLNEDSKPETRDKIARRIVLLHEVIQAGIAALSNQTTKH